MKLLILDGNSILNRAFYAIPNLTAPNGLHTGGIYGFLTTFLRTVKAENPDMTCVAFDLPAPTFRHKAYDGYKATRHKMPQELAEQLPVLKDILHAMRITVLEAEGYEADDIIGTVSRLCEEEDVDCRILTGDRDDLQLVSEKTKVLLTTTRGGKTETVLYDTEAVKEKYGVAPRALIEVKGLMGDSSDNIPGVPGIGEKTALSLIQTFGTIEALYANLSSGAVRGARLTRLENGRDLAKLSRMLGEICRTVPLPFSLSDFSVKPYDTDALAELLQTLNFRSLLEELVPEMSHAAETVSASCNPYDGQLADADILYFYGDGDVFYLTADGKSVYRADAAACKALFENAALPKVGHGIKYTIVKLKRAQITLKGEAFDTALAAYLLDPAESRYDAAALMTAYLQKTPSDDAAIAALLPSLKKALTAEMEKRAQTELYFDLELPTARVLAEMELAGLAAEKAQLAALSRTLSDGINGLETSIYAQAGETFNIKSPKQLGEILFEKMGLPAPKKTKTGYTTDAATLEKLRGKHPIIEDILEYRQLTKLKSTYADALREEIDDTGRIHSVFHQTVTATGRISSSDPNLQNIPVRTQPGREIRKVFTAPAGKVLIDADYSQIELRVLAHMSGDARMQAAFLEDVDIHTRTAAEIFGVAEYMVTPEMRSRAKTINFGIIYGMGDFTLANDLKISRKQARSYIDSYMETYAGVRDFMENAKTFARENGYVKTMLLRRRYIPQIRSGNFNIRAFGERVAMNAPIQGSAADIIKLAMLRVFDALAKESPLSRLVLQVHDELIVEAPIGEAEKVQALIRREMENAIQMQVPLKVDVGCGESWYAAKP